MHLLRESNSLQGVRKHLSSFWIIAIIILSYPLMLLSPLMMVKVAWGVQFSIIMLWCMQDELEEDSGKHLN